MIELGSLFDSHSEIALTPDYLLELNALLEDYPSQISTHPIPGSQEIFINDSDEPQIISIVLTEGFAKFISEYCPGLYYVIKDRKIKLSVSTPTNKDLVAKYTIGEWLHNLEIDHEIAELKSQGVLTRNKPSKNAGGIYGRIWPYQTQPRTSLYFQFNKDVILKISGKRKLWESIFLKKAHIQTKLLDLYFQGLEGVLVIISFTDYLELADHKKNQWTKVDTDLFDFETNEEDFWGKMGKPTDSQ